MWLECWEQLRGSLELRRNVCVESPSSPSSESSRPSLRLPSSRSPLRASSRFRNKQQEFDFLGKVNSELVKCPVTASRRHHVAVLTALCCGSAFEIPYYHRTTFSLYGNKLLFLHRLSSVNFKENPHYTWYHKTIYNTKSKGCGG